MNFVTWGGQYTILTSVVRYIIFGKWISKALTKTNYSLLNHHHHSWPLTRLDFVMMVKYRLQHLSLQLNGFSNPSYLTKLTNVVQYCFQQVMNPFVTDWSMQQFFVEWLSWFSLKFLDFQSISLYKQGNWLTLRSFASAAAAPSIERSFPSFALLEMHSDFFLNFCVSWLHNWLPFEFWLFRFRFQGHMKCIWRWYQLITIDDDDDRTDLGFPDIPRSVLSTCVL